MLKSKLNNFSFRSAAGRNNTNEKESDVLGSVTGVIQQVLNTKIKLYKPAPPPVNKWKRRKIKLPKIFKFSQVW